MAEPIEETAPSELIAPEVAADATAGAEVAGGSSVAADQASIPILEPVKHEPVPVPETVFGDTPLSAIERLSIPGDLSPQIRRRDRFLTAAWAASFAILAGLGVASYTERNLLMRQWPASKRVYATLGLVPLEGPATAGSMSDGRVPDGNGAGAKDASGQRPAGTPPR